MIGTVVIWNSERGFGFLARIDGGADVFAHCSNLTDKSRDHLPIGTRVQFDIEKDARNGKLRAVNVTEVGAVSRPSPRDAAQIYFRTGAELESNQR